MTYDLSIDILFILGRVLFGGYFLISGWNHFKNAAMLTGYAESKGVPQAKFAVLVSGAMIVAGGFLMVLGIYPEISITLIALFLVLVTPKMHAYWTVADPMTRMSEMVNFRKNVALLGAVLMFLYLPQSLGSTAASSAWPFPLF